MGTNLLLSRDRFPQQGMQRNQHDSNPYQNMHLNVSLAVENPQRASQIRGQMKNVPETQSKGLSFARSNNRNSTLPFPSEAGNGPPVEKRDKFSSIGQRSSDLDATTNRTSLSEREREILAFREFSNRLPITSQYDCTADIPTKVAPVNEVREYVTKTIRNE